MALGSRTRAACLGFPEHSKERNTRVTSVFLASLLAVGAENRERQRCERVPRARVSGLSNRCVQNTRMWAHPRQAHDGGGTRVPDGTDSGDGMIRLCDMNRMDVLAEYDHFSE